jgi:hypothetical protein
MRPKAFILQSLHELEEIDEQSSMAKAIQNNLIIEKTISKLEKDVIDDNIVYLKMLNEKIIYTKKQYIAQQEQFKNESEFLSSSVGKMMEQNLRVRITKFNEFLRKINIKQRLELPLIKKQI